MVSKYILIIIILPPQRLSILAAVTPHDESLKN
jgi:hypothetical protein